MTSRITDHAFAIATEVSRIDFNELLIMLLKLINDNHAIAEGNVLLAVGNIMILLIIDTYLKLSTHEMIHFCILRSA